MLFLDARGETVAIGVPEAFEEVTALARRSGNLSARQQQAIGYVEDLGTNHGEELENIAELPWLRNSDGDLVDTDGAKVNDADDGVIKDDAAVFPESDGGDVTRPSEAMATVLEVALRQSTPIQHAADTASAEAIDREQAGLQLVKTVINTIGPKLDAEIANVDMSPVMDGSSS